MERRIALQAILAFGVCTRALFKQSAEAMTDNNNSTHTDTHLTLFLCGDVMTGRGIDQVLPHPSKPRLYEFYAKSAKDYVIIAEQTNGTIHKPVTFDYIWGEALTELEKSAPDLRLINLETAVTASDNYWPGKGINYRMHPANIPAIAAAEIDGCILANNHVMDWGRDGLIDTLESLEAAGIKTAGAGRIRQEAIMPAVFELPGKGRLLLFAYGHESSGVPSRWGATEDTPGVNLLDSLSHETATHVARQISKLKQPGDRIVVSIHWGGNWGYQIPDAHQQFAHWLIDEAGVDLIHGHSSHHPRGIEHYRDHLILYGCGDFLNDYEGIRGHEMYRGDLSLMYFVTLDLKTGRLVKLEMVPMQIRRFRLERPSEQDQRWLLRTMDRECRAFGAGVTHGEDGRFRLT